MMEPKVQRRKTSTSDGQSHRIRNLPEKSFWNPFLISNPPGKSFREPLSDQEHDPRNPPKVSEKGFSGFRKTVPMLFYPKPRDGHPLVLIPKTTQVVLGALYLDGGPFGGGRASQY